MEKTNWTNVVAGCTVLAAFASQTRKQDNSGARSIVEKAVRASLVDSGIAANIADAIVIETVDFLASQRGK